MKKLSEEQCLQFRSWVDEDCGISLKRIRDRCMNEFDVDVSERTVSRCLLVFHYTFKPIHCLPIRRNAGDTIETRHAYAVDFMRILSEVDRGKIFFFDEAGYSVSMRAKYGRSQSGTRAVQVVRALRGRNVSVLCFMHNLSLFSYDIQLRAYNTTTFCEGLDRFLDLLNQRHIEGAVLIGDNVRFNKVPAVLEKVRENSHRIRFIPPYSPFLNPVEHVFSKWKNSVRNERPQNNEHLLTLIQSCAAHITADDCGNFFRHMLGFLPVVSIEKR